MMDGRVKTLHPAIHGGILARRASSRRPRGDRARRASRRSISSSSTSIRSPRRRENPDTPFDELVEEIDIGGPSLLRAAAKNFRDVLVVVDPADYPRVLEELARPDGPSLEFRFELMQKAFAHTAQYDGTIAMTLASGRPGRAGRSTRRSPPVPPSASRRALRYGENPHQKATWMPFPEQLGRGWQVHQGKELSYTNLLDLDAALRIALEFTRAGGRRDQAHEPVRRRDRRRPSRRPTSARARPIRSRPSAASSASTARSTPRPRGR